MLKNVEQSIPHYMTRAYWMGFFRGQESVGPDNYSFIM